MYPILILFFIFGLGTIAPLSLLKGLEKPCSMMEQEQKQIYIICTGAPLTIGGSFSSLSNEEMSPVLNFFYPNHVY
jgi:hypothetical protein